MESIFIITFLCLGFASSLEEIPMNVAGVAGNTITLTCKGSEDVTVLIWERSTIENPSQFSAVAGTRIKTDFDSATHVSTLKITNLATSDAGTYSCKPGDGSEDVGYAQVVVLGAAPVCHTNHTLSNLASGDFLEVACIIEVYSATEYSPGYVWYVVGGDAIDPTNNINGTTHSSVYAEEIKCDSSNRQYQVDAAFPPFTMDYLQDQSWNHATNAPSYGFRYASTPMTVLCQLEEVTVEDPKEEYDPGDKITCMANMEASLPITYEWSGSGMTFSGETLTIPGAFGGGMVTATCTGTQTSENRTFSKSVDLSFTVTKTDSDDEEDIVNRTSISQQFEYLLMVFIFVIHSLMKN